MTLKMGAYFFGFLDLFVEFEVGFVAGRVCLGWFWYGFFCGFFFVAPPLTGFIILCTGKDRK